MNDETVNRILDMLERIGSEAAREGFALAVRYQVANGIVTTLFCLAILALCIYAFVWGVGRLKEDDTSMGGFTAVFASVLVILFATPFLYGGIMRLLIPEWYAVQALFGLVTGGG